MADDPLDTLLALLSRLCRDGRPLTAQIQLGGWRASLTVEPIAGPAQAPAPVAGEPATPWHEPDYRLVVWPGLGTFTFGKKQAAVVARLWQAWQAGRLLVEQRELLALAGTEGTRLRDCFRNHEAWGKLIVAGELAGTYRLPVPLPGEKPI